MTLLDYFQAKRTTIWLFALGGASLFWYNLGIFGWVDYRIGNSFITPARIIATAMWIMAWTIYMRRTT